MSDAVIEQRRKRKREYNRQAQRAFRERRRAYLAQLENAFGDVPTQLGTEIDNFRRENEALRRENYTLRAGQTGCPSAPVPVFIVPGTDKVNFMRGFVSSRFSSPPCDSLNLNLAPTEQRTTFVDEIPPSIRVILKPYSSRDVRHCLDRMFAPMLEGSVASNCQAHLGMLELLRPTLPAPLKPTALQLSTPHHHLVDLIPSPTLRNRLIMAGMPTAHYFLTETCPVICDVEDIGQLLIWGDDWLNECAWEFSDVALQRWAPWLLGPEWVVRANFWRRQRRLPSLPPQ